MNALLWVVRIVVGILFILSGFVKAVDPAGLSYKLQEYFVVFGMEIFNPFTVGLAVLLTTLEIVLGVMLLVGVWRHTTTLLLLLLIIFFTFLTGWSAITNQVTDCGCFGDALKLTPWQSFIKDLVLFALILFLFLKRYQLTRLLAKPAGWAVVGVSTLFALGISIYGYTYLPMIDWRPYKVGNDIQELMEQGEPPVIETVLIYEKDGQEYEFGVNDLPENLDEYTWKETKTETIKEAVPAPIHDFAIFNTEGDNLTNDFLSEQGYRLLIVQNNLNESRTQVQNNLNMLVEKVAAETDASVWALTSSPVNAVSDFRNRHNVPYPFYTADATTLKTIIRSNPGLLLLEGNRIVAKWPSRKLPTAEEVQSLMQ